LRIRRPSRPKSGPLGNLLRDLAEELLLPLAALLGFLAHGLETLSVCPLANLLLGSAFRLENGLPSWLANSMVIGLRGAVATGLAATLAPGGLVAVPRKTILLRQNAAARAFMGIDHRLAHRR